MAINLNDNINTISNKPLDNRYSVNMLGATGYYETVAAANLAIPIPQRHRGLTVGIKLTGGLFEEYWYRDGVADINLIPKGSGSAGAENGLNVYTNNKVRLGGTLLVDTTVELSQKKLTLKDTVYSTNNPTGITISPGVQEDNQPLDFTKNSTRVDGKFEVTKQTYLQNNVGIGYEPYNVGYSGHDTKLYVVRFAGVTDSPEYAKTTTSSEMYLESTGGQSTTAGILTGLAGSIILDSVRVTGNQTLNPNASYSGINGGVLFGAKGNVTGGSVCSFTSGASFAKSSVSPYSSYNLETYISYRAKAPVTDILQQWGGTLTNSIGLQIDDQRTGISNSSINGYLTYSYGVIQGDQTDSSKGRREKNIFNGATAFNNNVVIGLNDLTNRYNLANNEVPSTRLYTYRSSGYTSEAITVASNSLLEMGGNTSNWTANGTSCSTYAGTFDYLYWAPYNEVTVANIVNGGVTSSDAMTITGQGSYLSVATPAHTIGGNLASNTAQVYSTNTFIKFSGVSSLGSVLTLPYLTDPDTGLTITVGSQITIVSGTGSFGTTKNVFVYAIVSAVSPYKVSLKTYINTSPTGGYISFTPTVALSGATIEVGLAGGNIDKVIAYRAKGPVPYQFGGSLLTIGEAVGIQIDDQRALINTNWNTSDQKSVGTLVDAYGIKQLGNNDINQLNGPLQLPSANTSIGTATLIGGTKTVSTTAVKTGSRIFISRNTPGGTVGHLSAPAASITNGVSFVINSSSGTDTSTVNWWVIQS